MSYGDDLGRALSAAGITGALRKRILTEIEDHLDCNPDAELGAPQMLARQFADELGTIRARRAATRSFIALAFAGVLFGVAFVGAPAAAFGAAPAGAPLIGRLARILAVLAPQIAFVSGLLAGLRAWRRRRVPVVPGAEAQVMLRRAWLGTASGLAAMVSLAVIAPAFRAYESTAWFVYVLIAAGVSAVVLLAVTRDLLAAGRVKPLAEGPRGDIFDDLGPLVSGFLRGRPWRFAITVALGLAAFMILTGWVADDLYDGIGRGVLEAAACLLGFATLGRWLGLWSPGIRPE